MDWGGEAIYRRKRLSDFDWPSKNFPVWRGELVWLSTQEGALDRREPQMIAVYTHRCLVGSAPHCLVRISDPRVYPVECQLVATSRGVFARNISGRVLRNNQSFEKVLLGAGDVLTLGPVELILSEVNPLSWTDGVPGRYQSTGHSSWGEGSRLGPAAPSFLAEDLALGSGGEKGDWEPCNGIIPGRSGPAWVIGWHSEELVGLSDRGGQSTKKTADDGWPGCSVVVALPWDTLDYEQARGPETAGVNRDMGGKAAPSHSLRSVLGAPGGSSVREFWASSGWLPAGNGRSSHKQPSPGSSSPYPSSIPTQVEDCRAIDPSVSMPNLGEWSTIVAELRSLLRELRKVQKHSRHKLSPSCSLVRKKRFEARPAFEPPPAGQHLPDSGGSKTIGSNSALTPLPTSLANGEKLGPSGVGPLQLEPASVANPGFGSAEPVGTTSTKAQEEGNGASGGMERKLQEAEGTTRAWVPPKRDEFSPPVGYLSRTEGAATGSSAEDEGCLPGREELCPGELGTFAEGRQEVAPHAIPSPAPQEPSEVVEIRKDEFNSEQANGVAEGEERPYREDLGGSELAFKEGQNASSPPGGGHDSSAEEINAYLQQLLSRLRSRRGLSETPETDSAHTHAADSHDQDPAKTVGGAENLGQRGVWGTNLLGRFGARFGLSRAIKKQDGPQPAEISVDLDSFRVLASHSARSALTEYRRRRLYQSARGKLWTAAFALGVAATLVGIAHFAPYPPPALIGAWVAIGIAAVMLVCYAALLVRGVALWLEQKRIDLQTSETATALALEQLARRDSVSSRGRGTLQNSGNTSSRSEPWDQESTLKKLSS